MLFLAVPPFIFPILMTTGSNGVICLATYYLYLCISSLAITILYIPFCGIPACYACPTILTSNSPHIAIKAPALQAIFPSSISGIKCIPKIAFT